jgi:hypothetical protein
MARGLQGQGYIGIGMETTYGTYIAPTVFFPIRSESMNYQQDTYWRRAIRGVVDIIPNAISGFSHVEGEIEAELIEAVLPYFLLVGRYTVAKTGTTPNFTYTATPNHIADNSVLTNTAKGMSITVVRSGVVFGYVGCLLGGLEISVDSGIPIMRMSIVGSDEASQSLPTPTWATGADDQPFGAGQYSVELPTASQVFDVENFTFTTNENAEPQYRLANSTKATFVKFGEREVALEATRDFASRAEYDSFKALTASSVTITCTKGVNNSVSMVMPASVRESYDLDGLSSQGDLEMATVKFNALYDTTTSRSHQIIVKSQEDITV